jgi:alginate O-acetyltransferase complex protein AlgI
MEALAVAVIVLAQLALLLAADALVTGPRVRRVLAVAQPVVVLTVATVGGRGWAPVTRLAVTALVLYTALKAAVVLTRPPGTLQRLDRLGLLLYLTVWPGMEPDWFLTRARGGEAARAAPGAAERPSAWVRKGLAGMGLGLAAMAGLAVAAPALGGSATGRLVLGWAGIVALLLTLHLGYADVLSGGVRAAGFPVPRLFRDPLAATTLADFWSRRWNLAFVEMDKLLFLPPLRRALGRRLAVPAVFAVSGLLHELAISFPGWGGWGLPLAYFLLHGALLAAETRVLHPERWPVAAARTWVLAWLPLPLPLLFPAPFRTGLVIPLYDRLNETAAMLPGLTLRDWFSLGLWLAGAGHIGLLGVSLQIPARLKWRTDLQRVSPMNRKLLWAYGGFTVGTIVAFALLTFGLHAELLAGDRAALGLALFIGCYWLARVVLDAWYGHSGWPEGTFYAVGHVLLMLLFTAFVLVYLGLVGWHVLT